MGGRSRLVLKSADRLGKSTVGPPLSNRHMAEPKKPGVYPADGQLVAQVLGRGCAARRRALAYPPG